MGWKLNDKGQRVYVPTKKSFWNRLEFIVTSCGGRLDRSTTGFTVIGGRFTEAEKSQIQEEITNSGISIEIPTDIEVSVSGRETPSLD